MPDTYKIVDDFHIKDSQVLVLDRDFDLGRKHNGSVNIDGALYPYTLNSVRTWVIIKGNGNFKDKIAVFN